MKILNQLGIIIGLWFAGELINKSTGIKIPGSVIGMLLLLVLLNYKILDADKIKPLSDFFLGNLAFFFIPANVLVMGYFDLLKDKILIIFIIIFISTIMVMFVTGRVVQALIYKKGGNDNGKTC